MPSDQGPPGNYPGNYQGNYPGGPGGAPGEPPRKQPGFFSQQRDSFSPQGQENLPPGSVDPAAQRRRSMRILAVVVSFGFFAFIIWFSYQQGHQDGSDSTPPLIKADVNPTRVRPDAPGGMEIPNQDKLIYNRVDPSAQAPTVERLLSPPETPLPRGRSAAAPQEIPEPSFPKTGQFSDIPVPVLPQQLPPQFESDEPPPAPVSQAQRPRQLAPAAPAPAAPAPAPKAVAAPAAGGYLVQLGAFRSEDAASKGWTRVQGQHKDLLATMTPSYQRADLGPKGVFFRLRAGPLASESAAKSICSELAKRKAGCLVIRP